MRDYREILKVLLGILQEDYHKAETEECKQYILYLICEIKDALE